MAVNLTDRALEAFRSSDEDVLVSFRDGSSLTGRVVDFDGYTVVLTGTPDLLVYRHSILKLIPAAAAAAFRPERRSSAKAAEKPQARRPAKEKKPSGRGPRAEQKKTPAESGFANPMADKMLEWLKKQKGGG